MTYRADKMTGGFRVSNPITQVEVTNPGIVSIGRLDSNDLNISQWVKRFFKAVVFPAVGLQVAQQDDSFGLNATIFL